VLTSLFSAWLSSMDYDSSNQYQQLLTFKMISLTKHYYKGLTEIICNFTTTKNTKNSNDKGKVRKIYCFIIIIIIMP